MQSNVNVAVEFAVNVPKVMPEPVSCETVYGPVLHAVAVLLHVTAFAVVQFNAAFGMSVTTAPVTLLGPAFETTTVYRTAPPTTMAVGDSGDAVFTTDKSAARRLLVNVHVVSA